jgi:penicillin amidase
MAVWQFVSGTAIGAGLVARGLLRRSPRPTDLAQRLAMLPLDGWPLRAPVEIAWNDQAVPFISAAHDDDAAVALGAVQAHLRLGQLQVMRRIAQGRVAEMVGPLGIELDRALLLFDFARSVPATIAALAPETRSWAEHFLAGLNHHIDRVTRLPEECRLLGIGREHWGLADLFTVARLASADVTWIVFARLLRAQRQLNADWPAVLHALMQDGSAVPSGLQPGQERAEDALAHLARMGSNAAVVGGRRTTNGAALIASDPHLGLGLPNLWLLAGLRAPGLHAVGLMLAGFPFIALGRNRWIAWGGTSLHAASSELVDVRGDDQRITTQYRMIQVRGAGPTRLAMREHSVGPVVSDGMILRNDIALALRWVGHAVSDELGCFLRVMRAPDWDGFQAAFRSFAVPGQTMLFAAADGRIGHLLAGHLPRRPTTMPSDLISPPDQLWSLDGLSVLSEETAETDPAPDFYASANERPGRPNFPVGYFFAATDRQARLAELLHGDGRLDLAAMRRLQADVHHPAALALRDRLLAYADAASLGKAAAVLAAWDGAYAPDSAGALVFEILLGSLANQLKAARRLRPVADMWTGRALIARAILGTPAAELRLAVRAGLRRAGRQLRRHRNWGGLHRVKLVHPLARLPLLGRRFHFGEMAAPGGNDTLNKTGTGLVRGRHATGFGTCARHISDMSDLDENYFVLFGGQDGWIGSANQTDQAALWRDGRYIRLPMRPESVAAAHPHRTLLQPS